MLKVMWRANSWKTPWYWERLKAGGEGDTEDEMVGWHHGLNGHEFEKTLEDSEGQGSLVCCSPWGHEELDMTEWTTNPCSLKWNFEEIFLSRTITMTFRSSCSQKLHHDIFSKDLNFHTGLSHSCPHIGKKTMNLICPIPCLETCCRTQLFLKYPIMYVFLLLMFLLS